MLTKSYKAVIEGAWTAGKPVYPVTADDTRPVGSA
jgi:hypothetical protein